MKRIITVIALLTILFPLVNVSASTSQYQEPFRIRATCYTASEGAITCDGTKPFEGIVAGKKEWLNCLCIMYSEDMEFIGYFDFRDTGAGIDTDNDGIGDSIRNGKSIDVYRSTLDRCYEWIAEYGDYVYIQVIPAEG